MTALRDGWLGRALVLTFVTGVGLVGCSHRGVPENGQLDGAAPGDGGVGDGGGTSVACGSATDCPSDSACLGGRCCAAGDVCGQSCCSSGTVCIFGSCETPGKVCASAGDCPMGQYCESSLGTPPDMLPPQSGGDGGVCSQSAAAAGRCIALPQVCADGGVDDGGCTSDCEYHPPVGALDALAKWTWGPRAKDYPDYTDIWSTPVVGRLYDSNCDGHFDALDAPDLVFVSGDVAPKNCNATGYSCKKGVLRMLDGKDGHEIWSLAGPGAASDGGVSDGGAVAPSFAGQSVAIGDIDGDGVMDIVAMLGDGHVVMVNNQGQIVRTSDQPVPNGVSSNNFGWGGGLAIGDLDGDGHPEIVYGATVFATTNGAITLMASGTGGIGASSSSYALSTLADLDGDGQLDVVAGNTAYKYNPNADGGARLSILWKASGADGFDAVADLDGDGKPEVVRVAGGKVDVFDGATGAALLPQFTLPGTGAGGPPTIADFDGDGKPEIGVAMATYYSVMKPDFTNHALNLVWKTPNHDLSSSVTGSTVFDFQGDGKAEVIYADECYLWVFDGPTGAVELSEPHTSFTATESSLVADVDGDGHAEIVMLSNGADTTSWKCKGDTTNGVSWTPPDGGTMDTPYRGLTVFGDRENGWVGTRTLWNEHTYHVSNICDDRDDACPAPDRYGSIPKAETPSWKLPWLNAFRQNVQDKGLFNAPDATVALTVDCQSPIVAHPQVRNIGLSSLPAGVLVTVYRVGVGGAETAVGTATTTVPLGPGQSELLSVTVMGGTPTDGYVAEVTIDPAHPLFHECRAGNDASDPATCQLVK